MDRIRGEDLVSLVPHQLGYRPRESLVLVMLRSSGARLAEVGLMIRLDFPEQAARGMTVASARDIAALVTAEPSADSVVLVFFGTGEGGPGSTLARAADLIAEQLGEGQGILVREALWADAAGWGRIGEPGRHPHRESAASTRMLVDGSAPAPSVRDLCRLPALVESPGEVGAARRAVTGLPVDEAREALRRDLDQLRGLSSWGGTPRGEGALDRVMATECLPGARTAALLTAAAADLTARDEILALLGRPGDPHAALRSDGSGIVGLDSARPDAVAVGFGVAYARRWAALTAAAGSSPVAALTIVAWLEWARMRTSWAAEYLRAAREADADYGLAVLLDRALEGGMRPAWIAQEWGAARKVD